MEFPLWEVGDEGQQNMRSQSYDSYILEFINGLPGLFSLCILGEIQSYDSYILEFITGLPRLFSLCILGEM